MKTLTDLIKLNISSPSIEKTDVFCRLAIIFAKASFFDQAINHFCLGLGTEEDIGEERKIEILLSMAICCLEKGDYKNALRLNESALMKNNKNVKALLVAAWCEFIMGRHMIGLTYVERAISLEEKNAGAHYIRGRILLAIENVHDANEAFKKGLLYDGSNIIYMNSLGITYVMKQDLKKALDSFIDAIKINSVVPEIWFNIGLLYEMTQQYPEALKSYKEALKADANFYPATVTKQSLSNNYIIPPSYLRFVHLKYFPVEAVSAIKEMSRDTALKISCENYFKTAPDFPVADIDKILKPATSPFEVPMKVNLPGQNLKDNLTAELIKGVFTPLLPNLAQPNFRSTNKTILPKPSEREDVKEVESKLKIQSAMSPKQFTKPQEQCSSPNSALPKTKFDKLQLPIPISETQAMEELELETLCQLLRSQQKQVQSLMQKHGLILPPSTPKTQALSPPIRVPEKQLIIQPLPLRYIVEPEETSRRLARPICNNVSLNQFGTSEVRYISSNIPKERFINNKSIEENKENSKNKVKEDISKKEEMKTSNRVVLTLTDKAFSKYSPKKEEPKNMGTIVRLNISKKRKHPEINKGAKGKEYKTQCKRNKY